MPTFTRESERRPVVGEVEKRLGIKFMVAALPDYSLLLVLRVHREPGNVCIYKRGGIKWISLAAQSHAVAEGGKAPVSPCKPLCAILFRKPSVYPLSPVKANVGRL